MSLTAKERYELYEKSGKNDEYRKEVTGGAQIRPDWQMDPTRVKTETVQLWNNGIMVTAQLKLADAREMVRTGRAFVISGQAIRYNEDREE